MLGLKYERIAKTTRTKACSRFGRTFWFEVVYVKLANKIQRRLKNDQKNILLV